MNFYYFNSDHMIRMSLHKIFKPGARQPQHAWILKIDPVRIIGMRACMCVCVCVSAPEAINN